ncbi:hypothetical protein POTOM_058470 [Populus tomentosa]|uniref:Uncharacterized protein n=1 Tax=Populus tomentosa TaxID=118781 RepID=A0A8X8C2G4_POPTO|nr:hypothetical protein POTOM_058470 [Populus tomentosa]
MVCFSRLSRPESLLVEVTARVDRKTVSAERNITAPRNVSEAEWKPRAKINEHLETRVPGTHRLAVFCQD